MIITLHHEEIDSYRCRDDGGEALVRTIRAALQYCKIMDATADICELRYFVQNEAKTIAQELGVPLLTSAAEQRRQVLEDLNRERLKDLGLS